MSQPYDLRKLLDYIFSTHPGHNITCDECEREFHCLAERVAAGENLGGLLPAVEAHLECCADCREEFEGLLAVVRAEQDGTMDEIDTE